MDDSYFSSAHGLHSANGGGLFEVNVTACSPLAVSPGLDSDMNHTMPFASFSPATTTFYGDASGPFVFDLTTDHKEAQSTQANTHSATTSSSNGAADEDAFGGLSLPQRKQRALNRLSLTSSIASSVASTTPSEADPSEYDAEPTIDAGFSMGLHRGEASSRSSISSAAWGTEADDNASPYGGPQTASASSYFDDSTLRPRRTTISRHLDMPYRCDRVPDLVHSRSSATIRDSPIETITHNAFASFNLADFISDEGQSPAPQVMQEANVIDGAANARLIDGASNVRLDAAAAYTTPQRPMLHRDVSSLQLNNASYRSAPGTPDSPGSSPVSSMRAFSGSPCGNAPPGVMHMAAMDQATSATRGLHIQPVLRSLSYGGGPMNSPISDPNGLFSDRPLQQQQQQQSQQQQHVQGATGLGLFTITRPDMAPRSYSTSHAMDMPLSCNPAHITPCSSQSGYDTASIGTDSIPNSPAFSPTDHHRMSLGGEQFRRASYMRDPSHSPISPFTTSGSLIGGDDRCSTSSPQIDEQQQAQFMMSCSAPTRRMSQLQRAASPGSPATPGHPVRSARMSAAMASQNSSPYQGPHLAVPPPATQPTQQQQQQQLYTGIITKRSRGRRVPSNPEEMNNLGKSGKVYTCKVPGCGKCFKRSEHLKRHVRSIHTDEKPYMCSFPGCLKRFSRHDNLNQHTRVHAGMPGAEMLEANKSTSPSVADSESPRASPSVSRRASTTASALRRQQQVKAEEEDDVFSFDEDEDDNYNDEDVKPLRLGTSRT